MILGLVQGLTEFLPVSSSGHLAILNLIFSKEVAGGVSYTFFLHIATLIAAGIYFRNDLRDLLVCWLPRNAGMVEARRLFLLLIVACLVTGPIGLAFDGYLQDMSDSLAWVACGFFATSLVLVVAERLAGSPRTDELSQLSWGSAALVGLFQGIAVVPGLSRSGSTIAGGLMAGLKKEHATRFAFLVGLPIIAIGALKDGIDLMQGQLTLPPWPVTLIGFVVAGISGYLAINWMITRLQRTNLNWFAVYTALLGAVLIGVRLMRG